VLDTMQNWADSTLLALPGYRDRVTEVRLAKGEGGINLQMPPAVVDRLVELGGQAATQFDGFDFERHRWIRYRVGMSELDALVEAIAARYAGVDGYEDFLAAFAAGASIYPVGDAAACDADRTGTGELIDLSVVWGDAGHPANAGDVPQPKPTLRIVPRF
jgi:hypothetical protein